MENLLRRQLKEEMKNIKPVVGIVSVKNIIDNKIYIEGTINANALINKIKFALKTGQFENKKLQYDWNEMGENSFLFEIISEIKEDKNGVLNYRNEVLKLEKLTLNELKPYNDNGYNESRKNK